MSHDPNRRTHLVEGLMAAGLTTIGLITGQGPLASLVASVGSNLVSDMAVKLTEQGMQSWRDQWPTNRGVLNQDLAEAFLAAFQEALEALEQEWKHHPYYLHMQRTDPQAAAQTLSPFHWLREDSIHLFEQPQHLASLLQQPSIFALLHRDENQARHLLSDTLAQYLYGHDDTLVTFLKEHLADEWLHQLNIILHNNDARGTRAWRAAQYLWQSSLEHAVTQLDRHSSEILAVTQWVQQWAQRLDQPQRDTTGEEALQEALRTVEARLDALKATIQPGEQAQFPSSTKSEYSVHVTGNIQGLVQGDHTNVTMHFGETSKEQ